MTSKHPHHKPSVPAQSGTANTLSEAELALPQKTDLPLAEDPIAQVAVPATINGTSPLDTSEGPLPPKQQGMAGEPKKVDRSGKS